MDRETYNSLLARLAANQPLPGLSTWRRGMVRHKWPVKVSRWRADPKKRTWRVDVGTGCVNDQEARIEYRRKGDPRGWEMPDGYPPFEELRRVYGASYPFVDRPMWEEPRPFCLVTAPSLDDPKDLGGFVKVPARPSQFRTKRMWEWDLYYSSVWVSVSNWRADPSLDLVRGREMVRRFTRWRVFAGRLPLRTEGVRVGSAKEIARLWLLRDPKKKKPDRLIPQQRVYWNLQARSVEPTLGFEWGVAHGPGFGGIGGGLADAAATALFDLNLALAYLVFDGVNQLLENSGTVEFWSV